MRAAARAVEQEADSQSDDDDDDDDLTKSQQRKLEEMNDMADDLEVSLPTSSVPLIYTSLNKLW